MGFRWRHLADQPYLFTVGAWGVLFPLLFLFPRRIPGMIRRRPEDAFFVFFFASLCVVANNTERELATRCPPSCRRRCTSCGCSSRRLASRSCQSSP